MAVPSVVAARSAAAVRSVAAAVVPPIAAALADNVGPVSNLPAIWQVENLLNGVTTGIPPRQIGRPNTNLAAPVADRTLTVSIMPVTRTGFRQSGIARIQRGFF